MKKTLIIEGILEQNSFNLRNTHMDNEIVRIDLEIVRSKDSANDKLKTFSQGKILRITIEEVEPQ